MSIRYTRRMSIRYTRRTDAEELRKTLAEGPSLSGQSLTAEQAEKQVRLWLDTWIIPKVERLVPELSPEATERLRDDHMAKRASGHTGLQKVTGRQLRLLEKIVAGTASYLYASEVRTADALLVKRLVEHRGTRTGGCPYVATEAGCAVIHRAKTLGWT